MELYVSSKIVIFLFHIIFSSETSALLFLNKSNIDKVHVYGKYIRHTFNKIKTQKKGKIFNNKKQIFDFINNEMANRDNLMIKASNSVGLNKIISKFKK